MPAIKELDLDELFLGHYVMNNSRAKATDVTITTSSRKQQSGAIRKKTPEDKIALCYS